MLQKHRGPQLFEAPVETKEIDISEKFFLKGEEVTATAAQLNAAGTGSGEGTVASEAMVPVVQAETVEDALNLLGGATSDSVAAKADQSEVDTLATAIGTKADQSEVDTLATTIGTKADQSEVDTLATTIGTKADQSEVDTLATTVAGMSAKTILTEKLQLYISPSGNDTTGDGSSSAPWATMQKAANWVGAHIYLNGYDVTVNMAAGTYTDALVLLGDLDGPGYLNFVGDIVTPSNVLVSTTFSCFQVYAGKIGVSGIRMAASAGYALTAQHRGEIYTRGPVEFGACSHGHMYAATGGLVRINQSYTIVGDTPYHIQADVGGKLFLAEHTCTLSGTRTFTAFARAANCGCIYRGATVTYTGSATGIRYSAVLNGVINTFSAGASFFPGSVAGSTATGGQYF